MSGLTYDEDGYAPVLVTEHHHPLLLGVPAEHGDERREVLRVLHYGRPVLLRVVPDLQRPLAADDAQAGAVVVTPPDASGLLLDPRGEDGDGALLGNAPDEDTEVGARAGEDVRVGGVPADGRDGLLVLRHDGQQAELLEVGVQLRGIDRSLVFNAQSTAKVISGRLRLRDILLLLHSSLGGVVYVNFFKIPLPLGQPHSIFGGRDIQSVIY